MKITYEVDASEPVLGHGPADEIIVHTRLQTDQRTVEAVMAWRLKLRPGGVLKAVY